MMKSPLELAYLGDAVYELYVREYLLKYSYRNMHELEQKSLDYVTANNQKRILDELISNSYLTNEELEIIKNGRNQKGHKSKSSDIITYKLSTGFECLIGYLYINDKKRLDEIMQKVLGIKC